MKYLWGAHFVEKLRSQTCDRDYQNNFQKMLCKKNCYGIFIKYKSFGGICILKIVSMHSITGA